MKATITFLVRPHLLSQLFSADILDGFEKLGEVRKWDGESGTRDSLNNTKVVITSWGSPRLEEEVLDAAPHLKFIFHAAGSVKPYVSPQLMEKGVRVSSGSNIIARDVALTTLGYVLLSTKKIFWWNEHIKKNKGWRDDEKLWNYTADLCDVKIGIIAMSWVGRSLLELLRPLSDKIFVYDPYWSKGEIKKYGGEKVGDLLDIAKTCDIVVLCAPLTEKTKGMLGKEFFENMRDGSVFINPARGGIVDEEAMIRELEKERIFACLDVTDPVEPPAKDSKLRNLKNVVVSPHIAGCIKGGLKEIGKFGLGEVKRFLNGEPLVNEITLERWDILA